MPEYNPELFQAKRNLLGMTAEELAKECKVTRQTITNVEIGKTRKPVTVLFIGLVLDILADEQGKLDAFYELEKGKQ